MRTRETPHGTCRAARFCVVTTTVSASTGVQVRMLRALVATLVAVGFGGWAHEMGGGEPLRLIPAVVLTLLVGPVVCLCVRRRSSVPRMLVATSLGQVVAHLALTGMAPRTGGWAVRLHLHEVAAPLPLLPTEGSSALSVTGTMLLAHAVATVVASLLLTVGADVVRAVVRRLVVLATLSVPVTHGIPARTVTSWMPVLRGRVVAPLGGRAPPLLLV
jgi:hypothetical protein